MSAPYRNENSALQQRKDSLERELAQLRQETRQLDELRARQEDLERELTGLNARLGAGRRLPVLDDVRVASPCNASWNDMVGDERVRFCGSCSKNVYNLSSMAKQEAEQFLAEHLEGKVCVRFYRRTDGTVLTEDCSVGQKKKRRRQLAFAITGASAMAVAALSTMRSMRCSTTTMGEIAPVQGKMGVMGQAASELQPAVIGSVAAPEPPPPQ